MAVPKLQEATCHLILYNTTAISQSMMNYEGMKIRLFWYVSSFKDPITIV